MNKEQIMQQIAIKKLEERFKPQQEDLIEFIKLYFERERPKGIKKFHVSNFHLIIADKLHRLMKWEFNKLIINIPPWHWKTELITKSFPVWVLWNNPHTRIMATGYSTTLTQQFSSEAKEYYKSDTFRCVFPRRDDVKKDQDTKEHRATTWWWSYYATWFDWSITGNRCNIFIIDDPIKPNEAEKSEVVRVWVNNLFENTVPSRLFDPAVDKIIIIMQRTHDDDLCGYLLEKMWKWWTKRELLSLPAIATDDESFDTKYWLIERKKWEPLDPIRFPLETLEIIKKDTNSINFSTQYQQEPTNRETQEFHEERFRYHWTQARPTPPYMRIFTAVDPAFKTWQQNDQTSIITAWFIEDKCYILEITAGRITADVMQEQILYHIRKRQPEKIGIEAFQAQSMIVTFLKSEMQKRGIYADIEEITQTGDKLSKIRKLVSLYKNWLIYHTLQGSEELEHELKRFPRGKHDDIIDSLQMLYNMYELVPNTWAKKQSFNIEYDYNGNVIYN